MEHVAIRPSEILDRIVIAAGLAPVGVVARAGAKAIEQARFDEADAILARGLARSPDHPALLEHHAFSAHNSGRYAIAVERWAALKRVRPDRPMAWCGLASNYREQGLIDQASHVIEEALPLFPDDLAVIGEAGRVAHRRGDYPAALALWTILQEQPDPHPDWSLSYIQSLIYLARFDEARSALDAAQVAHPDHRGFLAMEAILAMAREDWDRALEVWTRYRAIFPDDPTGWEQQGRAIAAKQLAELDHDPAHMAPAAVQRVEDEEARSLLLGFESIGKDCEFGIVQRRHGAEPLGLLRWTDVTPSSLSAALDARFADMGSPDTTELVDHRGYYSTVDRRWGFRSHTFVACGQADRDVFFPKMCKRIAYLRDKLLADLASGEKIFVYKSTTLNAAEMRDLHARMQTFGPVRLLCVKQAEAAPALLAGKGGDVIELEPSLHVGFLRAMGNAKGYWDIAFDDWISICRSVADRSVKADA